MFIHFILVIDWWIASLSELTVLLTFEVTRATIASQPKVPESHKRRGLLLRPRRRPRTVRFSLEDNEDWSGALSRSSIAKRHSSLRGAGATTGRAGCSRHSEPAAGESSQN